MSKPMSAVEKAHARLKKLQDKKGGGDFPFNFLDIQDGTNIIRIFKSWNYNNDSEAEFYKELPYHRAVGPEEKQVKCRGAIGKPCPVCEEYVRLKAKAATLKDVNKEKADAAYKKAAAFKARPKFFMNAVRLTKDGVIGKDGEAPVKPEVLSAGPMIMDGVLSQFVDDEADIGGKFWEEGSQYDFVIKRSGEKLSTNYEVKPTKKYLEVDTSELESAVHNLDELFAEFPSYEEIKAIMNGEEYDPAQDDEKEEAKEEKDEVEEVEEEDVEEEEEGGEASPKKKAKPAKVEEDEEEVEEDDAEKVDEDDDEDDVDPPPKKPTKVEEEDEIAEEKGVDEKPVCFGEPEDHDPSDKVCRKCPWFKKCATEVANKADDAGEEHVAKVEKKLKKVAKE